MDINLAGDTEIRHKQRKLILQRVLLDRPTITRSLYWRVRSAMPAGAAPAIRCVAGALDIPAGSVVSFDTYFNAFFELQWRMHTVLSRLMLKVECDGRYHLQIKRQLAGTSETVYEEMVEGRCPAQVAIPFGTSSWRQNGALYFELTAMSDVRLHAATWITDDAPYENVGLAAVFCTFNREKEIARVLASIAEDEAVLSRICRIYVVNQGQPNLESYPAIAPLLPKLRGKLCTIEHGNFGGAGGFTAGIMQAQADPAISHVVLLDDDIELEPDSLLRMAAFFDLSKSDMPVGGHMLDAVRKTRLGEAGAVISDVDWTFRPNHADLDLSTSDCLAALIDPVSVHYNGWWCLGLPLTLVEQFGLPLPVFIRGDDVEYGLRLYAQGMETVVMPGIAVWHEPFYLKLGGWQIYYETRNILIAAALHMDISGTIVARRMFRHFMLHLLTFRYYSAALIIQGMEDFLAGPAVLDRPPLEVHASLAPFKATYPARSISRSRVMKTQLVPKLPKGWLGYFTALLRVLARSWMLPARAAPPKLLSISHHAWIVLEHVDHIALDTWWDASFPAFSRSRQDFRILVVRGFRALAALRRKSPGVSKAWREAAPKLTSAAFWHAYLAAVPKQ